MHCKFKFKMAVPELRLKTEWIDMNSSFIYNSSKIIFNTLYEHPCIPSYCGLINLIRDRVCVCVCVLVFFVFLK